MRPMLPWKKAHSASDLTPLAKWLDTWLKRPPRGQRGLQMATILQGGRLPGQLRSVGPCTWLFVKVYDPREGRISFAW